MNRTPETRSNYIRLNDGTLVQRYYILTTSHVFYRAWRKGGFDKGTATMHFGGEPYYEVGREQLPATFDQYAAYTEERLAAVTEWHHARFAEARRLIMQAFPEVQWNGAAPADNEYVLTNGDLAALVARLRTDTFAPVAAPCEFCEQATGHAHGCPAAAFCPTCGRQAADDGTAVHYEHCGYFYAASGSQPATPPTVDFDNEQLAMQAAVWPAMVAHLKERGLMPETWSGDEDDALTTALADEFYGRTETAARRALKALADAGRCQVTRYNGSPMRW